jgi:hypothetical protein
MHQDDMTSEKEQPREDTALSAEEWKRKYAELKVQLTEKTADLHLKNRELEIEAALERVRARTMGMQHSSELTEISFLLVKQVLELGVNTWGCAFNIFDEDQPSSSEWFSNEQGYKSTYKIPREGVFLRYYEAAQRGESLHVEEFRGDVCIEHYRYLSTLPGLDEEMRIYAKDGIPLPTVQFDNVTYFKYGYLLFVTYEDVPEAHDIFKRFAKVFEQTYTRFLDLQKAEAQAREAQIETALERVRSRAMAMHKSDELLEVIAIVAEQLKHLNFRFDNVSFAVRNQTHDYKFWLSSPGLPKPIHIHVPYTNNPMFERVRDVPDQNLGIYTDILTTKENRQWHEHVFENSELHNLPAKTKKYILDHGYARTIILMPTIMLIIGNYASKPYTEEENNVFKRFAGVFEQSYTRFLDLQKAEAQAREAQIEAALEKVRSRSLAMHSSTELEQVVGSLFDRLVELDLSFDGAGIFTYDKEKRNISLWIASTHLAAPVRIKLPFDREIENNGIWKDFWHAFENGIDIFHKTYPKRIKNEYFRYVAKYNDLPERIKRTHQEKNWTAYFVASKHAMVGFDSWSEHNVEVESYNVLKRFAAVFDQCYTRFLDLQKAEAQAREAQIETALERVRARTMGMQKSEDLREVVKVLYAQLKELEFKWGVASIIIMDADTGDFDWWMEGFNDGFDLPEKYHVPYFDHKGHQEQLEHWRNGSAYAVVNISGEEKKTFDQYYFYHTDFIKAPENSKSLMMSEPVVLFSMAYMQYGALSWSPTSLTEEQAKILQRFAKVFEQTYTRFLDLQKAEAQARESQIQLALERVRARTMAMQHSNELAMVSQLLFQQFHALDIHTFTCTYMFIEEEKNLQRCWVIVPDGTLLPDLIDFPLTGDPILNDRYQSWKEKQPIHEVEIHGKLNKQHHRFLASKVPQQFAEHIVSQMPDRIFFYSANFSHGYLFIASTNPLSAEEKSITIRFANVFQQTYTRFLDLQKAEAQAREAQIEAALERVRSSAMAMQSSSDLNTLIGKVFTECTRLDIQLDRGIIMIYDPETKDTRWWMANPEAPDNPRGLSASIPQSCTLPGFFGELGKKDQKMDLRTRRKRKSGLGCLSVF